MTTFLAVDMTAFLDWEVRSRIADVTGAESIGAFVEWFAANTLEARTPLVRDVEALLGEADTFTADEFVEALRELAKPVDDEKTIWNASPPAGALVIAGNHMMEGVVLSASSSTSRAHVIASPALGARRVSREHADT